MSLFRVYLKNPKPTSPYGSYTSHVRVYNKNLQKKVGFGVLKVGVLDLNPKP